MDSQYDNEVHIDLAHRERRRADRLLLAHRFDEAISAHQDAITQLEKVLVFAEDPVVNESIQLQIAFHVRQQLIVNCRRERQKSLLKRQASISYCRETGEVIEIAEMALPDQPEQESENEAKKMHVLLNHNADLLQQLFKRAKDNKAKSNDCQVIDDLRANNTELRKLLESLATDNRGLRQRNRELRDEIEFLRSKLNQVEAQPRIVIPELAPLERPDFDE